MTTITFHPDTPDTPEERTTRMIWGRCSTDAPSKELAVLEQFLTNADPDTWPEGIEWGGDLPTGTGGYVLQTSAGAVQLQHGDWIKTAGNGEQSVLRAVAP